MEINQIHALNLAFSQTERKLTDEIVRLTQHEHGAVAQLTEQVSQTRRELESLLRNQVQRELQVSEQLLTLQQQAADEKAELVRSHSEQERSLHSQYAEREKTLTEQLRAGQQEAHRLQREWGLHEKEHAEHASQSRKALETQLRSQAQREQEIAAQLLQVLKQAEQEKTELARNHIAQECALRREHAERQQILTQQLQTAHETLRSLERNWAHTEKALGKEIAALQHDVHALHHAKQLLAQQHEAELSTKLGEHQRVLTACAVLVAEIKAEVLLEEQASQQLRESLAEVQHHLDRVHMSLSWRMTAPLRKLATFIAPQGNSAPASFNTEDLTRSINKAAAVPQSTEAQPTSVESPILTTVVEAHLITTDHATEPDVPLLATHETVSESLSINNIQDPSIEAIMPPFTPVTMLPKLAPASTLEELLEHHDQKFVECAYQTLLGRAPDSEGFGYYLGRIRSGFSKARIISQMVQSREGKFHNSSLVGLADLVRLNKLASNPYLGWYYRALYGIDSEKPLERKLRALENQVYIGTEALGQRLNKIDSAISRISQLLAKQQAQGSSMENMPNLSSIGAPELERLSPRATKVFVEIKSKIAQKSKKEELL